MTRRRLLRVIVPLLAALLLTLVVARATARPNPRTTPVVVAAVTVPAGSVLSPADLKVQDVPPSGALPGSLRATASAVGEVAKVGLSSGAPVLADEIEPQPQAGLAYQIPRGERALTLAVNGVSGIAGNLAAGLRVDVLLTVGGQTAGTGQSATAALSTVIAQNIAVLSTGLAGGSGGSGYALVTLAVSPTQAATIALGQQQGSIVLLLRAPGDHQTAQVKVQVGGVVP